MTGNPFKAAADYVAHDRARRAAQVVQEVAQARREPEPGIRCLTAPVPERILYGEPTSRWNGDASPVLGLPFEVMYWERPGGRTVSVRQFRVGIQGFD